MRQPSAALAAERGRAEAEHQVLRLRRTRDQSLDRQKVNWHYHNRLLARITDLETALAEQSSQSKGETNDT
jgi:hypothetical protein